MEGPGPINTKEDLKNLIVDMNVNVFDLGMQDYFYRMRHLKDNAKEEIHYKVLDD